MKELIELAVSEGFKAKTLTTGYTERHYTSGGKIPKLITPMCEYLLLCEIQKWIRDTSKFNVEVNSIWSEDVSKILCYSYSISCHIEDGWKYEENFDSYEEALKYGIEYCLKVYETRYK